MELNFFDLSYKNGAGTTKAAAAAAADILKDPAAVRGAGIQWSFSNMVSALPQLLSFKDTQEDRPIKTILHPLASTGYMTMSTADAFVSNQKPLLDAAQKKVIIGKQEGNKHEMTVYPLQNFDTNSASSPQEPRLFSVSNQSNQASHVLRSNRATSTQNMVNAAIKPQSLGGVPHIAPVSLLSSGGSIVGSTDLRNSSTGQHAQLTIFYAGSVCVYDDISPEKAKAVMLLAGNGSTTPIRNKTVSTDKLQPPISMPSKDGGFITSQSYPSPMPTPLSVNAHTNFQPEGGSCSNNELGLVRPVGSLANPSNHLESPNTGSVGSAATEMVPPSRTLGLPQARKASLARFLEKRKERVMPTLPYYMRKKLPECSTPGSDGVGFSINSPGSCPLLPIN